MECLELTPINRCFVKCSMELLPSINSLYIVLIASDSRLFRVSKKTFCVSNSLLISGSGSVRRPLHPPELKQTELLKSPFHLKKHSVKCSGEKAKDNDLGEGELEKAESTV